MNIRTISRTLTLILAATAAPALAGPLDPPAGPAVSTMKTLAQVEPRIPLSPTTTPGGLYSVFTINQPGSYYLTGNISVPADKNGIMVTTHGVTIDLAGFSIQGNVGSLDGITRDSGGPTNITILNGSITNMGSDGISLATFGAPPPQYTRIEGVRVYGCGGIGMYFNDGIVRNSSVVNCRTLGLYGHALHDTVVEGCTVAQNAGFGIRIAQGVVRNCAATNNDGEGIMLSYGTVTGCSAAKNWVGIYAEFGLVTDCSVQANTDVGIFTRGGVVRNNSITANSVVLGSAGVSCDGSGARIEGNNITDYAYGIKATGPNNLIISNSLSACTAAVSSAAGNRVGPLVTGTYSPAINGNSGGGLGTTDPKANIIY